MAPFQRKTFFRRNSRTNQQHFQRADTTKALQAGNVKLCVAACTVAGTDGTGDKENQDCWAVEVIRPERERDRAPAVLFGVFDGHGEQGGTVAALAAEQLPKLMQESQPQAKGTDAALTSSFASTQQYLLQQPGLDCGMSGCTAVVALLAQDALVVANAGDSRCLVGRFEGANDIAAYELTNDHTPCLMHEANRILASGGRIAPFQYKGNRVGPPRVWERAADQPGLCITRSLGDTMAKRLGVTHVPEVATFPLTMDDRYLALVSDGITEFMGSQEVIEMIHKWASTGTMPHEVARRLVREARSRWKERGGDGVIDDCTAIVAYLVYDPEGDQPVYDGSGSKSKKRGGKAVRGDDVELGSREARTWGEWAQQRWAAVSEAVPWSLTNRSKRTVMTV